MVADETYQEVSLDPTLVTLQDLRERTTTLLQKFQGTGNLEEFYLEVVQELVTLCDATHDCFAELLPMLCADVIGGVHSNLAGFGCEPSGMSPFTFGMLESLAYFSGIVTDLR